MGKICYHCRLMIASLPAVYEDRLRCGQEPPPCDIRRTHVLPQLRYPNGRRRTVLYAMWRRPEGYPGSCDGCTASAGIPGVCSSCRHDSAASPTAARSGAIHCTVRCSAETEACGSAAWIFSRLAGRSPFLPGIQHDRCGPTRPGDCRHVHVWCHDHRCLDLGHCGWSSDSDWFAFNRCSGCSASRLAASAPWR